MEKLVSPGVFTEEKDLSYLPQGIAQIGAAFIGPTVKGPAGIPTTVTSFGEFTQVFGDTNPNYYLPYAAKEYLANSGQLTVVRTLPDDGYKVSKVVALSATYSGSNGALTSSLVALLHPSQILSETTAFYNGTTNLFSLSTVDTVSTGSGIANLIVSGAFTVDSATFPGTSNYVSTYVSASLNPTATNYIAKTLGLKAQSTKDPVYLYNMFETRASQMYSGSATTFVSMSIATVDLDFREAYKEATTPWIISQTVNNTNFNLFKLHTIADGVYSNYEVKAIVSNIKAAGTVAGSEYGSFSVTIRAVDQTKLQLLGSPFTSQDSDTRPNVLESFDNVNLDPNSPRYIARVIGDRYKSFSNGKVIINGNYSNKSKYVYVEMDSNVDKGVYSSELVPFGHAALYNSLPSTVSNVPAASFVTSQDVNGLYNKRVAFGFDYSLTTNDNWNYLKPVPVVDATTGANTVFLLSNYNQSANAGYPTTATAYSGSINLTSNTSIESRKFVVPFQGGADGIQPNRRSLVGSEIVAANTQGFDLSSTSAAGFSVYKDAIDVLSNPDEYDFNMLAMPGVLYTLHPSVIDYAGSMVLDRGDAFLVFDNTAIADNITTATDAVDALDNNYAATYYPWVKIMDTNMNKPTWVPPSVVIPGVLAFNDRVSAEWYAPAGLNRGGLTSVTDVYSRLTHAERDDLYDGRVNPIATFPGVGVAVWGQKTLQAKPSALDRINVRRLLIAVKKYIASATKYLVFEQNTAATRNRFLNIVNPYLESIQQRQGLYAFKVVMDETNNTPDLIDRNIMYGQIFLQPTKTAEFIVIDFNILPTGASFGQ
jgi:hypothetical protein